MKILITGCNGQVGKSLSSLLKHRNDIETILFEKASLDITNKDEVYKQVLAHKPDFIINAAAYTKVDEAEIEIDLCHRVNHLGAKNLALAAAANNATLLHISTDYIFDGKKPIGEEYTESNKPTPINIYGQSKLAGELAIKEHCSNYVILRTSWVFSEYGPNFVKTMLSLSQLGKINVVTDQFGGPTYAGDIANTLLKITEIMHSNAKNRQKYVGTYHYSGFPNVSWFEFAKNIFEQAKRSHLISTSPKINKISQSHYRTPAQRPTNSQLNCQKLAKVFNIPQSNWQSALKHIIEIK